jgi:hypothetical protein
VNKGADGLIAKLLTYGVAEKWSNEIKFTNKFFSHVALHSDTIRNKKGSVESWREMLNAFDSALSTSLDDEQVGLIIVLLDYYFEAAESNHANKS